MSTRASAPPEPGAGHAASREAWRVGLGCAVVGLTALGFGRFAFAVLLPAMREGLGLSYAEAGIVTGANLLGYLVGCLVAGALAGSLGARSVISAAASLAAAGAGLTAFGPSGSVVAGAQFVVGLGAGGAMLPAQNLPVIWFPPSRRGFASGLPSVGIGVGLVVAGTLFPALLARELFGLTGWRLAWVTIGAALLGAAICARLLLTEHRGTATASSLADVLRARRIWRLSAVYFLFGFSYISYVAFFGATLAAERHWEAAAIGRAWAMGGALSIVSGLVWGALYDRLGRRRTMFLVFAVQAASYLTMALVPSDSAVYASVALWGITAWAIPGLASAVATDDVGPRLVHATMALVTLVGAAGQMSGPVVTGYVADLTRSFVPGLILAAALALAGSAIAATLPSSTRDRR